MWANANDAMTVPRELLYDARLNMLLVMPIPEIKQLRDPSPLAVLGSSHLQPGVPLLLPASAAADVEIWFERPTVALTLSVIVGNATTFTLNFTAASYVGVNCTIQWRGDGAWRFDSHVPMLSSDESFSVRMLIDVPIIEFVFQGGRAVMTIPVPTNATSEVSHVEMHASVLGAKLLNATAWSMKSIRTKSQE